MHPVAATPAGAFAVYSRSTLCLAYLEGGGPILGPLSGAGALLQHPTVRGRLFFADGTTAILRIFEACRTSIELRERLEKEGYEVRPTPPEALRWALQDLNG